MAGRCKTFNEIGQINTLKDSSMQKGWPAAAILALTRDLCKNNLLYLS